MNLQLRCLLAVYACAAAAVVFAAEPQARTTFECRWCEAPLAIDGKADEPAWKLADPIDHFYLPWKTEPRAARTATKARLLWDREYLYFFAEMDDADLYADIRQHDGQTWNNDVFELFFKPAADKPGYYEMQVNAAGTKMDMFLPRRGAGGFQRFKNDLEFHWEAKVALRGTLNKWQDRDQGWSAEGRIPWRDFLRTGGRPQIGEDWTFALCRYDYSVDFEGPELSTCAPLDSKRFADFHRYEDYADLKFVGPQGFGATENKDATQQVSHRPKIGRPHGIGQLVPFTNDKFSGSPDPPLPYRAVKTLAKLSPAFPLAIEAEPGSTRLWFLDQPRPYAPTRLCRTGPDPANGEYDVALEIDGVAYSIEFHPKFAENGFVYVGWNGGKPKHSRVTRYTVARDAPHKLDAKSALTIIEWPSNGHNGAAITFGNDGMLYVTSGDGTSDSDTDVVGQDLTKLVAKVLRIDVDRPDTENGRAYSIPRDNPFLDLPGARGETWAYGFRNPWRMTTDRKTGHIWVGNNGQDLWEQVYLVERGANYGWSVYEGGHPFYLERKLGPHPATKPTIDHPHSESRSLTGGVVYYGTAFPELRGAYIYGDYSTGKIWGVRHDGKKIVWHRELADTPLSISGFGIDGKGELLIADHQGDDKGGFYTLEVQPPTPDRQPFPTKLSQTGLFTSVAEHKPHASLIPYSVNSPLWSDGAQKWRYLAVPGDKPRIKFNTRRSWEFPDGTVLVKSFALPTGENPQQNRLIETRVLTRRQGEWVGYSYAWNEAGTDAELVAKEGRNQTFAVATDQGKRPQVWRYPSRAECMVCHSRAANFVLGLSTMQMNKDHDYDGIVDNQLRVLEHLGFFDVDWRPEALDALRKKLKAKGLSESEIKRKIKEQTSTRDQRTARRSSLLAASPEELPRLANPYDKSQDLAARARSYLHVNCAQCHVSAGGGNAQFDVAFHTEDAKTKLMDVPPVHHKFGIRDAKLIAPGDPARSVLIHRVATRGRGKMPQLATSLVDQPAVELLREWVSQLKAQPQDTNDK